MSAFDPTLFGITMGQLVTEYRASYSWIAPIPHIATIILLLLIIRYGQRAQKAFTAYFLVNFIWLLIFVGGWFSLELYQRLGIPALAMYAAHQPCLQSFYTNG